MLAGRPLTGGFGGIHGDDLEDGLFLFEALAARKSELPAPDQGCFGALHGTFVNAPGVVEVSEGAVLPPEFECQEEVMRSIKGSGSTGLCLAAFSLVRSHFHLGEEF